MAMSMKGRLLLLLLCISFGTSWIIPPFLNGVTLLKSLSARQSSDSDPSNGCGPSCQACKAQLGCTAQAPPAKRSLQDENLGWIDSERLFSGNWSGTAWETILRKRVLEDVSALDINGLDGFLSRRANSRGALGLTRSRGGTDLTFTRQYRFRDRLDQGLVLGTQGGFLTGCTVLTVISRRAVYMGHFWQNLGFENLDENDPEDANFEQNVVNLIRGTGRLFYATGDALDPSLFNAEDDGTYAAIMTPRYEAGAYYFPDEVNRMSALITDLIPGTHVVVYGYVPDDENPGPTSGVALFEYDSDADGEGNADWRLWYEGNVEQGRSLGQNVLGTEVRPS